MDWLMHSTLLHPTAAMLAVPLVFVLAAGLAKQLVCQEGFKCDHFYLGMEATLAALSSGVIFITNLPVIKTEDEISVIDSDHAASLGLFLAVSFLALLVIMAMHQIWDQKTDQPKWRFVILGCFCNGVGLALLASSVVLAKSN